MKNPLLEIEAILSNATAELSLPKPKCEKVKKGIDVARNMLLDIAGNEAGCDRLAEAKRKLFLAYLGTRDSEFSDADAEIFSILSKERALKDEAERARKNN
jgi:hypothetical protein